MERQNVQIHNSPTLFHKSVYSGLHTAHLNIRNGARIVFTMHVFQKDVGAVIRVRVKDSFSVAMPFNEVLSWTDNGIGPTSESLFDFHQLINVELEVTGGSAEVILGMSLYDNAFETVVDLNAQAQPDGQYDSVRIGDGVDELAVNPDGSLNVNLVNTSVTPKVVKPVFNKITGVVQDIKTSIVSHTAIIGKKTYLQFVSMSGTNTAEYSLEINGAQVDERRTAFGSSLSEKFEFQAFNENGIEIAQGQKIEVFVKHYRPEIGDFTSRIQILEIG